MFLPIISTLVCLITFVSGNGELVILHHPKSLLFKGHDHVKQSILPELYSAAWGFSTQQYSNWNGLLIQDPFNLAEAVVTIAVDGVADIGNSKGHHYPLQTNDGEFNIYHSLEKRVSERYPESEAVLLRVDLEDGLEEVQKHGIFDKISHDKTQKPVSTQLKLSVEEDRRFLNDIAILNSITEQIIKPVVISDNIPDLYWFKIGSLHAISDLYGENSTQIKEAKQLLTDTILRLNDAFNSAYKGKVLVSVLCSDAIHTRKSRNILAADHTQSLIKNLAKFYSRDYPVIFNIILWFGVAMVFALLAICIAIADMDPGRDSIIYRMTSTRLKKD